MKRKIKLQLFFALLKVYNVLYSLFFPFFVKRIMLYLSGVKIGRNSIIQPSKFFSFGKINIGDNTIINSGCYLDNRRGITIGSNVVIAHDTKLYTLGHDFNHPEFITKGGPIEIKDYVVIFSNVLVMPGVTIEEGSVILPGAVVTKDVPKLSVVGGNPGKILKKREQLHLSRPVFKYWFSI